jgi:hypothetical protein
MAPEQVDGAPPDARFDLFSLGATLYQCATGQRAFTGAARTAILWAVTDHHPPPPHQVNPGVGRPLSDLIMRLLAKDPDARPQSAQDVADELAALGQQPATTEWRFTTASPLPSTRGPRVPEVEGEPGASATGGRRAILVAAGAVVLVLAAVGGWLLTHPLGHGVVQGPSWDEPVVVRYRGRVDVRVNRAGPDGAVRFLSLDKKGALPLRKTDEFRVEGQVEPPAYLYVVWVDPGHDVTPVYPWDPQVGWGSRPAKEERVGRVSLPPSAGNRYTAPDARPGVATMVLFACPEPLGVPDEVVRRWFEGLPDLPLPAGGERAAVWFDDYVEVRDPDRPRTFGVVGSDDAFARWQGQLQKVLGDQAAFETAASFARTGRK